MLITVSFTCRSGSRRPLADVSVFGLAVVSLEVALPPVSDAALGASAVLQRVELLQPRRRPANKVISSKNFHQGETG